MVILTTKQQQLTPGQKGNTGNKVAGGNGKNAVKGRSDVIEDRPVRPMSHNIFSHNIEIKRNCN